MKTLSSQLSATLTKGIDKLYYIIKITGQHKTTFADKSFYISDSIDTITDTTVFPVLRILNQKSISIKEQLDIFSKKASIGGFSLNLIDAGFSEILDEYWIYNREIKIYLGNQDVLTNNLLMYSGVCGLPDIQGQRIKIPITNDTFLVQKQLPLNIVTNDILDNGNSRHNGVINLGKPLPIIYGDHPNAYAPESTELNFDWNFTMNMVEALPIGSFRGESRLAYIVADHLLHTKDSADYRVWGWIESIKRYVRIDSGSLDFYENSGRTFLKLDRFFVAYDTYFCSSSNGQTVSPSWTEWINDDEIEKKDIETYSNIRIEDGVSSGSGEGRISVVMDKPDYSSLEDSCFTNVKTYIRSSFSNTLTGTTPTFEYRRDSTQSRVDISGVSASALHLVDTQTLSSDSDFTTGKNFYVGWDGVSTGGELIAKVYTIIQKVEFNLFEVDKVFVACKGKEAGSTLNGLFTDITSDTQLLENPAHIMADIIVNNLGISSLSDSYQSSATELSSWKFAFIFNKFINSFDLLQNLAKECKSIHRWNSDNLPSIDTITSETSNYTFLPNEIQSITTKKSSMDNVVNKLLLTYSNKQFNIEREDDRANIGSQNIYKSVLEKVINCEYIEDETTVGLLADHYVKDDAESFHSITRHIVEFKTSDLRGINFQQSGSFKPIMCLELSDTIDFDVALDNLYKCNGETWVGKKFKIISITKNIDSFNIIACDIDVAAGGGGDDGAYSSAYSSAYDI